MNGQNNTELGQLDSFRVRLWTKRRPPQDWMKIPGWSPRTRTVLSCGSLVRKVILTDNVNAKRVEFEIVLILQMSLFWICDHYKHISNNFFQVVKFSFGLSIWCKRISQLFLMNVLPLQTRDFYEFCAYLNGILYIFFYYAQSASSYLHVACGIDCTV